VNASGGVQPYSFSIIHGSLPGGLRMNAGGTITGTPSGVGQSNFAVQVKDSSHPANVATAKLAIFVSNKLAITTPSLPNGVAGISYSATVAASGGTKPYTFSIVDGRLPFGLSLGHDNGLISGTPTQPFERQRFTVQVRDSTNPVQTAETSYTITIFDEFGITTSSLPTGIVGVPYSASITAAGGSPPYFFAITSGSFPPGLEICIPGVACGSMSEGAIFGTPTTVGTSSFTVQVKDSANPQHTAQAKLSIRVTEPLHFTTVSVPPGHQDHFYDFKITAAGGTGPYTFSAYFGTDSLVGLSMSPDGTLSGVLQSVPGSYDLEVGVVDSSNPAQTIERLFPIKVEKP
jgi:hypothetical protein